jgi:xylulose-5-phosphate/fructose-6-phosphate phosphoketolase
MTVLNRTSRYDLAIEALRRTGRGDRAAVFERKLVEHRRYIREHDEDMPEVQGWRWSAQESVAGRPRQQVDTS